MTVKELNILHEKAPLKKDGIYSYRGILWAVKKGKFVAYVNQHGEVLLRMGAFNASMGDFKHLERYEWRKKLLEWLRSHPA